MANEEEHIEDLQHVYRECERSGDEVRDAPGIAKTFNRVIEELQEERSDDFIEEVDTVETASQMPRAMRMNTGKVSQMKSDSRHLIRRLGGEVPDVGGDDDGSDAPMVDMDVDLAQSQSMENAIDIDLDAVIDSIDDEHVQEWAEEFRDELESEETDESRLRDLYKRIFGFNEAVAASLVAEAITRGIDIVT